MQPRLPAELPQTGVRFLESRIHLVDEPLDHLDGRVLRHLADEARVEEEATHREHHLAVDIVLHVLEGLVSDPHRPIPVVSREVRELELGRLRVAVDPVGGLEDATALLGEVAQVLEEVLHLLRVAESLERVEREVRVAQPAEAVVPVAPGPRVLGKARRRGGKQRARVFVLVELERERRANDLVLVVARHARALHPAAPVVERALEEALGGLLETGLERLAPGEDEMAVVLEEEWPLVLDVGQRDVRREPHRRREARELDVVGRTPAADLGETVLVRRPAANPRARLAVQWTKDPNEHRRLEEAVEEVEPRREVDELESAPLAREHGAQHVRVLHVLTARSGSRRCPRSRRRHPVLGRGAARRRSSSRGAASTATRPTPP